MQKTILSILAVISFPLMLSEQGLTKSDPMALALLKGLEQRLEKYTSFRLEYTVHYEADDMAAPLQAYDHFFITNYKKPEWQIYNFTYTKRSIDGSEEYLLRLGDDVYLQTTGDSSVRIRNLDQMESYPVFEPHVRPMTSFGVGTDTIKIAVLYHLDGRDNWTVRKDMYQNISMWVVRCVEKIGDKDAIHELWIEEPSFRIYKKIYSLDQISIVVENTYSDDNLGPFPKETKSFRTEGEKVICNRTIRYTLFEEIESFPEDTFTLKSFNLPLNATVHDDRVKRRIGFWDGEKLVDEPVQVSVQEIREVMENIERDAAKRKFWAVLWLAVFGISLVIFFIALYLFTKKNKKP